MTLYELIAKITLQDKDYKKKLKDTEKATKTMGENAEKSYNKSSKRILKALGIMASAAKVAIDAMGTYVVVKSVKAFAEYEQLLGGIQKLYGNMGLSVQEYAKTVGKSVTQVKDEWQRLENVQNKVLQNANNAYKTAGMSANQYMQNVTGISAALIRAYGGDTGKAASMADQAMRDIADNANTFGVYTADQLAEVYTNLAKGQYQTLDNLFLGYGGTKEGLEQLIKRANELRVASGEAGDLVIDNFADIVEAIHLVQGELNITGTTEREAAKTIQGSLAMAKAAWENLLVGLADKDADIGQLVDNLVESLEIFGRNVIPVVARAITGISEVIKGLAPIISKELPKIVKDGLPPLLEAFVTLISALVDSLPAIIKAIAEVAPLIITELVTAIVENIGLLVEAAVALIEGLIEGINAALPVIIEYAPEIVEALIGGILASDVALVEGAGMIIKTLVMGLIDKAQEVFEAGKQLAERLKEGVSPLELAREIIGKITEEIAKLIKPFADSAYLPGLEFGEKLKQGIWSGISEKWSEFVEDPYTWGMNLGQKIGEGIVNSSVDVLMAIGKLALDITQAMIKLPIKGVLWGAQLIANFAKGIRQNASNPSEVIQFIIETIKKLIVGLVQAALTYGAQIIANFSAPLRAGIGLIAGIISAIANAILTPLRGLISIIRGVGQSIISAFTGGLRNGIGNIGGIMSSIVSAVTRPITNLIAKARTWGSHLVSGFASGISGGIGLVRSAASAIASGVQRLWGHSHPEEGPMADDYTWMPDMMKMFAQGIKDNAHLVRNAAENAFDLGGVVTAGFSGETVSDAGVQRSGLVMTFADAVEAFKTALGQVAVELDDDEVGSFVRRTVVKSVYA